MTETSGFMDPGSIDVATYAAARLGTMRKDGYRDGYLNELEVEEQTPNIMAVQVKTGGAEVQGCWYNSDAVEALTIDAADATLDRIDRIVVRKTATTSIAIAVLKGTAAGSPTAPALTQTSATWEISLAQVSVVHGTTAITNAMITDERDTSYCGSCGTALGKVTVNDGGGIDLGSEKITSLATPTADYDAATKKYVDDTAGGGAGPNWKSPVVAASTANVTLATGAENGDTIDGITLVTGDRVLLKNQTTGTENGIYIVAASGAPTRATDFDSAADALGARIPVIGGTVNAGTIWQVTNTAITWGTTALTIYLAAARATEPTAGTGTYYAHPTTSGYATGDWQRSSSTYAVTSGKILFLVAGTVSIKFDLKTTNESYTAYGKIYKNGVATGTERSASYATYVTQTAETITVAAGDYLEIYTKMSGGGGTGYAGVRGFACGLTNANQLRNILFL